MGLLIIVDTYVQYIWIKNFNHSWIRIIYRHFLGYFLRHKEIKQLLETQDLSGKQASLKRIYKLFFILLYIFFLSAPLFFLYHYLEFRMRG